MVFGENKFGLQVELNIYYSGGIVGFDYCNNVMQRNGKEGWEFYGKYVQ